MAKGDRVEGPDVKRLRLRGVEPIEIWDLVTDDGDIIWHHQQDSALVARAIKRVCAGTAVSRSTGPVTAARGIRKVFVTGGQLADRALVESLTRRLGQCGLDVCVALEPTFAAAGAAAVHFPDTMVIDVGQTQIKIVSPFGRSTFPRDFALLPVVGDGSQPASTVDDAAAPRAAFVEMMTGAIDAAVDEYAGRSINQVILALPCAIETRADRLWLGASSYVAMAGDAQWLTAITKLVPGVRWSICNDAELAVFAAQRSRRDEPDTADNDRELVVTFGFGLGGCVWDPPSASASLVHDF